MKRYTTNFHSILLTALCTALAALCSCTGDTDIDSISGNGNSPATGTPLEVRATVAPFQSPDASTTPATRIAIDNISTRFQNGDAIGLMCFGSGSVSSFKLVFSGTDGVGTWKTEEGEDLLYLTDVENYLAYYPYIPDLPMDNIHDAASAETELLNFFDTDVNSQLKVQNTPEKLAAANLMIAVNTPQDVDGKPTLTLEFKHKQVLIIVKPMRKIQYIPPTEVTAYQYHPSAVTWRIDDKLLEQGDEYSERYYMKICKEFNACRLPDGSYASLVPHKLFTSGTNSIAVDYTTYPLKIVSTYGKNSSSDYFAPGTCHILEVRNLSADDGKVERPLKVGDFVVCTDGGDIQIIPGDCSVDANGFVPDYNEVDGIVVTCDPTKISDYDKTKGWTHAYVMGLDNIIENVNTLWSDLTPETALPVTTWDEAGSNMNGYSETQMVLNGTTSLFTFPIFNRLIEFRKANPLSTSTYASSDWFIPSIGQWFDVLTNLGGKSPYDFTVIVPGFFCQEYDNDAVEMVEKINSQLRKVDKPLTETENKIAFWFSSKSKDDGSVFAFQIVQSLVIIHMNQRPDKSIDNLTVMTARPFFAF